MDRISTSTTYQSALLNILGAQTRQAAAQNQVSTGKVASDLKGFGVHADALTATRSLKARIESHIENSKMLASTLEIQDQALGQMAGAAQGARMAVAEALATGSATGLLAALQGLLGQAVDSMNTEFQGRHLFAGGRTEVEPLPSLDLADLTAAPSIASLFRNDQLVVTSRVDDTLVVETGFLADALAGPLLEALKAVQALHESAPPTGPISGSLTQAQDAALTAILQDLDTAWNGLNEAVARNGGLQNRLQAVQAGLKDRQTALTGLLGEMVEVDMAAAVTRLELARTALHASAQVFGTLTGSSLLDVLSR